MKLLRKLALALASLVLTLGIAEVLVRVFAPQDLVTEDFRYASHPQVGFRLEPNTYIPGRDGGRINSLGVRGEDPAPKGANERRVLVLGDSFTYGAGVATEEVYVSILNELDGGNTTYFNAGSPAYGTLRERAWLDAFGEEVEADEVLLAVFVGNDFTDNQSTDAPRIFDGRLLSEGDADEADWVLQLKLWRYQSHLYRLLARRKPKESAVEPAAAPQGIDELDATQRAQLEQFDLGFADANKERLRIYLPAGVSGEVDALYALMEDALGRVQAWCEERELPLSLLLIPDKMQVEPERMEQARRLADPNGAYPAPVADRPQQFLAAWCAARGLDCVDVLPAMRSETARRAGERPALEYLYLFNDTHWNAAGHRLAAELVHAARSN